MPSKPTKRPPTKATRGNLTSIQGGGIRGGRSHVARLNDETKKHAFNHGLPWSDDDVGALMNLIDKDDTTYNMALATGRSYYAAAYARAHLSFAQRHAKLIKKWL
jgi:hypothetical protein